MVARHLRSVVVWAVLVGTATGGITITVPDDYLTIQAAIDNATTGDTVVVYPGIYVESIRFNGKNIVLRSTNPTDTATVAATVIDGNSDGSVVTFAGTETSDCVLAGFTMRNGRAGHGSGIAGNGALATIRNNTISHNESYAPVTLGGGLYDCDGTIAHNTITGNTTTSYVRDELYPYSFRPTGVGGGLSSCDGNIRGNVITNNSSNLVGGGLHDCQGTIQNNTIYGNSAGDAGGGLYTCLGTVRNCVLWRNSASNGAQLDICSTPSYCCIQDWTGGGEGNISADPLFTTGPLGPYYLSQSIAGQSRQSSCVDAGSSTALELGLADRSTRTDGWPDEGVVDMGYHYPGRVPSTSIRREHWSLYR